MHPLSALLDKLAAIMAAQNRCPWEDLGIEAALATVDPEVWRATVAQAEQSASRSVVFEMLLATIPTQVSVPLQDVREPLREHMVRELLRHGARLPNAVERKTVTVNTCNHADVFTQATLDAIETLGPEVFPELDRIALLRSDLRDLSQNLNDVLAKHPTTLCGVPLEEVVSLIVYHDWYRMRMERPQSRHLQELLCLGRRLTASSPRATRAAWVAWVACHLPDLAIPFQMKRMGDSPEDQETSARIVEMANLVLPYSERLGAMEDLASRGDRHPWLVRPALICAGGWRSTASGWQATAAGMSVAPMSNPRPPSTPAALAAPDEADREALVREWDSEVCLSMMEFDCHPDKTLFRARCHRWQGLLRRGWDKDLWQDWEPETRLYLGLDYLVLDAAGDMMHMMASGVGVQEIFDDVHDILRSSPEPQMAPAIEAMIQHRFRVDADAYPPGLTRLVMKAQALDTQAILDATVPSGEGQASRKRL